MRRLPRIPWEKAPDWANYAAYQPTGALRWFRKLPRKEHLQWSTNILDDRCQDHVALSEGEWGASLQRRPQ
jgi:hypothetical protein